MLNVFLGPLAWLISTLADLYIFVIVMAVVASWLVAFEVLSLRNPLARQLVQILDALTEPVFRQIRRIVPPIGGLDLSPLIAILGIELVEMILLNLISYVARA
jgi:YggT family protein